MGARGSPEGFLKGSVRFWLPPHPPGYPKKIKYRNVKGGKRRRMRKLPILPANYFSFPDFTHALGLDLTNKK